VHWGPRPGDKWPRAKIGADNFVRRLGTLDMQASLSANMMTLCCTDILDDYPDLRIHIHNLGGNIPYELERLDHRNYLDSPDEPLPSTRFVKPNLFVDCNSFGARAIELGVAAYGVEKIVLGTDGTDFGCEWSSRELAAADIGDDARRAILHGNAAALLADLAPIAPFQVAAE
jgi:predicted TIM-barrel fold metal-dependent hydrolase